MQKTIALLTLLIAFSAQANQTTVETTITCQQDDGDQWIEVGIGLNDGPGLRAYVVAHDVDDDSATLIASQQVFAKEQIGAKIYEDSQKTIKLVIAERAHSLINLGYFTLLQDGPTPLKINGLHCYENSSISFDTKR